jgi:hypothetical protein
MAVIRARGRVCDRVRVNRRIETLKRSASSRIGRRSRSGLTELGRKFHTDKVGMHHYTDHYDRHLSHLRDSTFNLLEIGIGGYRREGQGGASLRMWNEYFQKAQIVGLDIADKSFVDGGRISTVRGSQDDPELLARMSAEQGPFTVIIDDGSHRPEHIRKTFSILFPLLADDGIYAIEDVQTSYWPQFGGKVDRNDPTTTMALVKDLVDGLNYEEFLDLDYEPTFTDTHVKSVHCYHNLVFIEKGDNREGSNRDRHPREKRLGLQS